MAKVIVVHPGVKVITSDLCPKDKAFVVDEGAIQAVIEGLGDTIEPTPEPGVTDETGGPC